MHAEQRLAAVARRQAGAFSRSQAVEVEFTRRQISHRLASGVWRRELPSVYVLTSAPPSFEQRLWVACLWAGDDAIVSHQSAAVLWGFERIVAHRAQLWVPATCAKRCARVETHRVEMMSHHDRRFVGGLVVTSPERTLLDLAAIVPGEDLEIACESARRERLVTMESLERCLLRNAANGRAGVAPFRALLRSLAIRPCESVLEVKTMRLLRASSIVAPVLQHEVVAGGRTYRLDFAWPDARVALECDGRRHHTGGRDFQHDRTKITDLAADGWRTLIATWDDVVRRPDELLGQIDAALSAAVWLPVRRRGRRSIW
jgi:very-short-patch-repair endonuclease